MEEKLQEAHDAKERERKKKEKDKKEQEERKAQKEKDVRQGNAVAPGAGNDAEVPGEER